MSTARYGEEQLLEKLILRTKKLFTASGGASTNAVSNCLDIQSNHGCLTMI